MENKKHNKKFNNARTSLGRAIARWLTWRYVINHMEQYL